MISVLNYLSIFFKQIFIVPSNNNIEVKKYLKLNEEEPFKQIFSQCF